MYPEMSSDGVLRLGNLVPDFTAQTTQGELHWHEWIDGAIERTTPIWCPWSHQACEELWPAATTPLHQRGCFTWELKASMRVPQHRRKCRLTFALMMALSKHSMQGIICRQVGYSVFTPGGLHAGLHHRDWTAGIKIQGAPLKGRAAGDAFL